MRNRCRFLSARTILNSLGLNVHLQFDRRTGHILPILATEISFERNDAFISVETVDMSPFSCRHLVVLSRLPKQRKGHDYGVGQHVSHGCKVNDDYFDASTVNTRATNELLEEAPT